jgi:uncharacterized protein YndB with AHSA1/START domain
MKSKILKVTLAVVGILLGAAVALYVIGGRTAVYRADIEIDASPETVFGYLTETDLILQWMDGITKIEPLSEGEHRVGAKAEVTIEDANGIKLVMQDEVLKSEPGQLLQVSLRSSGFAAVSTYDLHSHGQTTHLSHELQANYGGLGRLFAPFFAGSATGKMNDDLSRLKELIERRPEEQDVTPEPAEPDAEPAERSEPASDEPAEPAP